MQSQLAPLQLLILSTVSVCIVGDSIFAKRFNPKIQNTPVQNTQGQKTQHKKFLIK